MEDSKDPLVQVYPPGKTRSSWVVLAKDPQQLEIFREKRFTTQYPYKHQVTKKNAAGVEVPETPPINVWQPMKPNPLVRTWTDDYADVLDGSAFEASAVGAKIVRPALS